MSKELRILYVEDIDESRNDLIDLLSGEEINGYTISCDGEASFDTAINRCNDYHIVILDIFQGEATQGGVNLGSGTFEKIKEKVFVPVIFYSGYTRNVAELKSQVVGVAHKGDGGYAELKNELERLTKHNIPFLRENVHLYFEEEYKKYFWEVIQKQNNIFTPESDDYSIGYMLLRNVADSLSRKQIKLIIGDEAIHEDKVHPMEFYIYPSNTGEFENGEIIKNKGTEEIYVIVTPSCDFIERFNKRGESVGRNAEKILIIKAIPLTETSEYRKYQANQNADARNALLKLINSSKGDRFFFLPGTPFLTNRVLDFQQTAATDYESLSNNYERVAKLDSPYAQSMSASFIRYFNRVGYPDIDTEYIINNLII